MEHNKNDDLYLVRSATFYQLCYPRLATSHAHLSNVQARKKGIQAGGTGGESNQAESSGEFRGSQGPPSGPFYSHLHDVQFLRNIGQIIGWCSGIW